MAGRILKQPGLFVALFIMLTVILLIPKTSKGSQLLASTAPSLWVTPLELDFGPVGVGYTSQTLVINIYNTGNATLTNFAGGGVYPPFDASQNCAAGVPPGGSCQYFFSFSPTEVGNFTTSSNSSTNSGPFSITLQGQGVGAGLYVNPLSLDFGTVHVGSSAPAQVVDIKNTGLAVLTNFAGGGVYPPFNASQNCAAGVLPGESCQYFFDFSPSSTGRFTETSNSSTNAGSFSIDLMGRGWDLLYVFTQRVTPRSLNFGPVGVDLASETLEVAITNHSQLTIIDWAGGGVYAPFNATQNCAGGLPPGESCEFFYTFHPTETGVFTTTSNVSNSLGSFTIDLRGEGVGADISVSQLALDFGSIIPGNTSPTQVVTIKNTGMSTLTNFAGGGLYPPFNVSQDCAGGVPPGGTCHYYFKFMPDEWGYFEAVSSTSTNGGSFNIQVQGGRKLPVIDMAFIPQHINPGEAGALLYHIDNNNLNATLFNVSFSNVFPSGLDIATPLQYSITPECGSPDFTPNPGNDGFVFSEATILGGESCTITIDVVAVNRGIYENSTSQVSSSTGFGNWDSDTLYVGDFAFMPLMIK